MTERERMKLMAINNRIFEFAEKIIEIQKYDITGMLRLTATANHEVLIHQMAATPAKLFRKDKPELDKRRVKRFNKGKKIQILMEE